MVRGWRDALPCFIRVDPWLLLLFARGADVLLFRIGRTLSWKLTTVAQAVAQEIVELGNSVDLLNGHFDVVLDAPT